MNSDKYLIILDNRHRASSGIYKVGESLVSMIKSGDFSSVEIFHIGDNKVRPFTIFEQFYLFKILWKNRKRRLLFISTHINTPFSIKLFKSAKLVTLFYEHLDYTPSELGVLPIIVWRIYYKIMRYSSSFILAQCPKLIYEINRNQKKPSDVRYIHWPVTSNISGDVTLPIAAQERNKKRTIYIHADRRPRKNSAFAIDVVKQLLSRRCDIKIIFGGINDKSLFDELVNTFSCANNVFVTEFADYESYLQEIKSSDIVFLPSHTEYEFSVMLYEVIHMGCQFIAPHNDFFKLLPPEWLYNQSDVENCVEIIFSAVARSSDDVACLINECKERDAKFKIKSSEVLNSILGNYFS